ncbi:MAG: apolipoprotein N-acyltransferase [Chthonomonadales bacterium]
MLAAAVAASAVLMTAAFPPLDWGAVAWFGLAPLLAALCWAGRARRAFALGYLFGWLHWGSTVTWIGTTVVRWSGTDWGWLAWFLLTAIEALWFGLFGLLAWFMTKRASLAGRPVLWAVAWALVEWLRSQTAIAMPWSLIGYTQYRCLPVIQVADLVGVYGVGMVVVLGNGAVATWGMLLAKHLRGRNEGPLGRAAAEVSALPIAAVVASLLYGFASPAAAPRGVSVRLGLMQPNISSERGATLPPEEQLARMASLAMRVKQDHPDLIVWPETIAPGDVEHDAWVRSSIADIGRRLGCWQLVGSSVTDVAGGEHNSAVLFDPRGAVVARYDKHWLVPMGEWVPLRGWLPFGDVFHFPEQDVVPGHGDAPLKAGPARLAVLICYESVFPVLARTRVEQGANLLVNMTNDSWAGRSKELAQHFAMTVFRAVETRRCAIAVATTGLTGVIEPSGRFRTLRPYRPGTMIVEAALGSGTTPYVHQGDRLVAVCGVIGAWWLWVCRRKR